MKEPLNIEDYSGSSISDAEYISLSWTSGQAPDFNGAPIDFDTSASPNNYPWTLSVTENVGTIVCLIVNRDNSGTAGSIKWISNPGTDGTFSMDTDSLNIGDAWIILITLDKELTDLDLFNSLGDYNPDSIPSQLFMSGVEDINGIGIVSEEISVY